MLARGIQCRVLDTSAVCHPKAVQQVHGFDIPEGVIHHRITSEAELEQHRADLSEVDWIVCHVTNGLVTPNNYPVMKWISRSGKPYILLCHNSVPGSANYRGSPSQFHLRMRNAIQRIPGLSLKASLIARLPLWLLGLRPAALVVRGGRKSVVPQRLISSTTRTLWAHSTDYDLALSAGLDPVSVDTAVFIDQYLPFHMDWTLVKDFNGIDPDNYYGGLRILFGRIEQEFGLKVVVAAHPKSDYCGKEHLFGDRDITFGRTTEEIRRSKLVITSTSQAISSAIIYGKPVLIYSTRDHHCHPVVWRYLDPICDELGKKLFFLENSKDANISGSLAINQDKYDEYIGNHVKVPESPVTPLWDIVIDELESMGTQQ
ncbi:hypothetical protein [Magnetospira sp. QH-2]|uniref:hypothetical protein n=1 Tax=Magnetospira sp. (strain QH-2) TaxID=1288970 RepID=UPI0003E80BCE|nr:hypothetical protein [Magnetospira sp. QH-2]CCQ75513.1 protein of unknown function [Magnetospira sp. QH-2]